MTARGSGSATSSDRGIARRLDSQSSGWSDTAPLREPARLMKIFGDSNSGNCLKVKWVCDALALPYGWIEIDTLKGESRTAEFLKLNGAGQVPTVVFEDGRALAQSNAIIRYLARAATSSRTTPLRRQRWTSGCSGSNTATSPISRCAASR